MHRAVARCKTHLSMYIAYISVSKPTPWAVSWRGNHSFNISSSRRDNLHHGNGVPRNVPIQHLSLWWTCYWWVNISYPACLPPYTSKIWGGPFLCTFFSNLHKVHIRVGRLKNNCCANYIVVHIFFSLSCKLEKEDATMDRPLHGLKTLQKTPFIWYDNSKSCKDVFAAHGLYKQKT